MFFKDLTYLFMRDRERQRHRQREKQDPCREPGVGINPWTPGSHPGPKAGAKPLSHPRIPCPLSCEGCDHTGPTTTVVGGRGHSFASPTLRFFYVFRARYDVAELNISLIKYI